MNVAPLHRIVGALSAKSPTAMRTFLRPTLSAILILLSAAQTLRAQPALSYAIDLGSGDVGQEEVLAVAVDGASNSYATGLFSGTVDFDLGEGTYTLTSGNLTTFIASYNSAGALRWALALDASGASESVGSAISSDPAGNVYVAGSFTGTIDVGGSALTSVGQRDVFVAKFDSDGAYVDAFSVGGSGSDEALALSIVAGYVVIGGGFSGTVDFDPEGGGATESSAGLTDAFVASYSPAGALHWTTGIGGTGEDKVTALDINDESEFNEYVFATGYFEGSATAGSHTLVSSGASDVLLARLYLQSGEVLAATSFGGPSEDMAFALVRDEGHSDIEFVVGGSFSGTVDFGGTTATAVGSYDGFVAGFTSGFGTGWLQTISGPGTNRVLGLSYQSVSEPFRGSEYPSVWATGYFSETANFGSPFPAGSSSGPIELLSRGSTDAFVVQYATRSLFGDERLIALTVRELANVFSIGDSGTDQSNSVASEHTYGTLGGMVLGGTFEGSVNFDSEYGERILTSGAAQDAFLARYARYFVSPVPEQPFVDFGEIELGLESYVEIDVLANGNRPCYVGFENQGPNMEEIQFAGLGGGLDDPIQAARARGAVFTFAPTSAGPKSTSVVVTCSPEQASEITLVGTGIEEDTSCPTALVIADFRTAPDAAEFVELENVGSEPIDFAEVNCVLGGFTSTSYLGLPVSGTLASGERLRFGGTSTNADIPFANGSLPDAYSGLALLDREDLPNGTPIPEIQPEIVTSLVYLGGGTVFGFFHTDEAHDQAYCGLYEGRLHTYGQSLCTGGIARGSDVSGNVEALDLAAMLEAARAEAAAAAGKTQAAAPEEYALGAAYPNPLRDRATVTYEIPKTSEVRVVVYDVLGRAVAMLVDGTVDVGHHEAAFDASGLASGTYVVRMTAGAFVQTQRLTIVR